MTPDTEEHVFHGEILTPDFIEWMSFCDLHQHFEKLAKTYGRKRAVELWTDIAEEHDDD